MRQIPSLNPKASPPRLAIWELGFRPFFLMAAAYAVLAILVWIAHLYLGLSLRGYLDPMIWHAHEMLFGYTTAVIAGFVLTASQNWTGKRGVHGRPLQFLAALWVAGRVCIALFPRPHPLAAAVDLAFYPALAGLLYPYLRDPELKMERVFHLYFLLFFSGNLLVHLESFGWVQGFALRGLLLGLNTIVVMVVFMGGRVIPFFTESTVARAQPRTWAPVEIASHVSAWSFLVSAFFWPNASWTAGIALAAALIHLIRLRGWQVPRVRRVPLIWVLHLSYLWIVVGFAFFSVPLFGGFPIGSAVHSFTVGALGVVTYGMISRVSLGHTGRRLHPSPWTVAGYVLLNLAAAIRVFGPLLGARWYDPSVAWSGALWSLSFAILLAVYAPLLIAPRADGRAG